MIARAYVGTPDVVRAGLDGLVEETEADELIIAAAVHDHTARLRSYELLAAGLDPG
jgi:alkanesulfonate monooxygenase SsuD/methylene tetrahydromethanopterin reductase-like flavin-dependent oxidoreductase (luciferase family)